MKIMNLKIEYKLDNYIISYNSLLNPEIYNNKDYYGIKFIINNHTYDITHNNYIGNRLFINDENGWKDIPFKKETFEFLPDEISIKEIKNEYIE